MCRRMMSLHLTSAMPPPLEYVPAEREKERDIGRESVCVCGRETVE